MAKKRKKNKNKTRTTTIEQQHDELVPAGWEVRLLHAEDLVIIRWTRKRTCEETK